MILLLDNYDSFTWNLFHYLGIVTDEDVAVKRNDEITLSDFAQYSSIIISPGPGLPNETPLLNELLLKYGSSKPILGVCLGLQAIAEAYGGKLRNLDVVQHGVQRKVNITQTSDRLMTGLPSTFDSGRYHSWVVANENLPQELEITATDDHGNIMAMSHKSFPVSGIQFHPESIMTPDGLQIMKNWILFCTKYNE